MKRLRLIFIALVVLLFATIICWRYFLNVPQATTGTAASDNLSTETNALSVPTIRPRSNEEVGTSYPPPVGAYEQNTVALRTVVNTWSNQVQRPIVFYGKVVDENEQPVQAANVSFSWGQLVPEKSFETNAITDSDGLFSIAGLTGAFLGVHVEKSGYYAVKTNQSHFQYWGISDSTAFQPDKNSPVVFHLRKKGAEAQLKIATLNVKIPLEGIPVEIDLLNQNSGTTGQLQVTQVKPTYETWKKASEWSFHMEIPDGGFIEEQDEFPFEAPETGYQSVANFDFRRSNTNWATDIRKSYYIKFGNPPTYGQLTVLTDISWAGARLSYAINPDGSRNLEPK
jgi:hypothetical protein